MPVRAKIVSGQVWKETAVAALYFLGQGTGNPSAIKTDRPWAGGDPLAGRGTGLVSARAGITETASTNARREKRTTEFLIELLLFIIFWDSLGPGEWGLARPKDTSFEAC